MNGQLIAILLVIVVAGSAITAVSSFRDIPVGIVAVKLVQSNIDQSYVKSGTWDFINPLTERLIYYDTRIQLYPRPPINPDGSYGEVSKIASTSSDGQDVPTAIALNYHPNRNSIRQIHEVVGVDFETIIIKNVAENTIKDVMGQYTADTMYQNREKVANAIEVKLRENLANYKGCLGCFELDNFSISDIEFSPEFSNALEAKAKAKTDAETAWNKVEQTKAEAQQAIESSKGKAEAARIINDAI